MSQSELVSQATSIVPTDWIDDSEPGDWEVGSFEGEGEEYEDSAPDHSTEFDYDDVSCTLEDELSAQVEDLGQHSDGAAETLERTATRLQSVGRAMVERLGGIQKEINSHGICIEVWLTETAAELGRSARDEPDGTTWSVAQLGYGPLGAGWGLLARMVNWRETGPLRKAGPVREVRRAALVQCSRRIQGRALQFIPELSAVLRDAAAEEADRLGRALGD